MPNYFVVFHSLLRSVAAGIRPFRPFGLPSCCMPAATLEDNKIFSENSKKIFIFFLPL